ncbi:MAG: DUF1775 domain-containing protein [Silicimonas sp.]|nr:DUF1775 domain-containing protein [Silicimonas sp.]
MTKMKIAAALATYVAAATVASAHATLEQESVKQGATSKITVRIGHGCGGEATLKVRVQVPDGMISVKPMPKADWTLETVVQPYAKSYELFGSSITEGVKEIVWTGELPDAWYDEFTFRGNVTTDIPAEKLLFIPVVQECANGAERWIEIPVEGQDPHDLESPAPGVMVLPADSH